MIEGNSGKVVIVPRQNAVSIQLADGIIRVIQEDPDQIAPCGEWIIELTPDAARRLGERLTFLAGPPA